MIRVIGHVISPGSTLSGSSSQAAESLTSSLVGVVVTPVGYGKPLTMNNFIFPSISHIHN